MRGPDVNRSHPVVHVHLPGRDPSCPAHPRGDSVLMKTLTCLSENHRTVFRLLTGSVSLSLCWVPEWRPVVGRT